MLALSERKNLAYKLVQIDRDTRRRVALEHGADTEFTITPSTR